MGDLRTQRETMMHSVATLRGAGEQLSRSKRLLKTIARRALANKLLLWLMIVLLASGILLLLWLTFFHSNERPLAPIATTNASS